MSAFFTHSTHMPCPLCGASIVVTESDTHVCDPDRRLDYELFQLREEVTALETGIVDYLQTPHGLFAQWYAELERKRGTKAEGEGGSTSS